MTPVLDGSAPGRTFSAALVPQDGGGTVVPLQLRPGVNTLGRIEFNTHIIPRTWASWPETANVAACPSITSVKIRLTAQPEVMLQASRHSVSPRLVADVPVLLAD